MNIKYLLHRMKNSKVTPLFLLGVICIVVLFFYFSFALFTTESERRGSLNIITGNLFSLIESSAFNEDNQVMIPAYEEFEFTITLTNINNIDAKVNLFFSSNQDLEDVNIGYLETNDASPDEYGIILGAFSSSNNSKTITVRIQNRSSQVVTLTFGSNVGLINHPLELPSDKEVVPEFVEQFGNLMVRNNDAAFWNAQVRENVSTIRFNNRISLPTSGVINQWDVSKEQDGSVIAFITVDSFNSAHYILHIQANGKIRVPSDSDSLFGGIDYTGVVSDEAALSFFNVLTFQNMEYFDTSNATSMALMFSRASLLTTLDVSHFDTSNVVNMHAMFHRTFSLTELDVSGWDTKNVVDMASLFAGANNISELDLSNWNTSKVTICTICLRIYLM